MSKHIEITLEYGPVLIRTRTQHNSPQTALAWIESSITDQATSLRRNNHWLETIIDGMPLYVHARQVYA